MNKAFNYGTIAKEDFYTNRTTEFAWLKKHVSSGINCTVISPRRWGKSSLISNFANQHKSKKVKFVFIDLFNVRTEEEFINLYGTAVLKATSNNVEDMVRNIKSFIKGIIPEISVGSDPSNTFEVSFNLKDQKKQLSEILNLPQTIAKAKGLQVVVGIDEFQNISYFDDGLAWQKKLRAHWQKHQQCNYIMYGSKQHMMLDFFTKSSMPFYKFGEILFLEKIKTTHWVIYIVERFNKTGKKISASLATEIATKMQEHPYFVQQLAMAVWHNTTKTAAENTIQQALDDLMNQYNILYQQIIETLSNQQLNFLKVICLEIANVSSQKVLIEYKLGTSANINRMKEALQKKEIIEINGSKLSINDPLFEIWLKARYFKIS
jgi:uncharacterized protein